MRSFKIAALSAAAIATLGASAAMAQPPRGHGHHVRQHKVCKIVRHHGHAKKVCRWVRR